jgi:tetratricopeptide (TPR) repeat protein
MLSFCYAHTGLGGEAVQAGKLAVSLEETFFTYWALQHAYHADGQLDKAAEVGELALATSGRHPFAMTAQGAIFADWGKTREARALYAELSARAAGGYVQPAQLSLAASAAGEIEQAIEYAKEGIAIRDPFFIVARNWPDFARLRQEHRFNEIVARMGLT